MWRGIAGIIMQVTSRMLGKLSKEMIARLVEALKDKGKGKKKTITGAGVKKLRSDRMT
jgi:hypothetical protein